jgi:hypothetical protein
MSRKRPYFEGLWRDPEQSPELRTAAAYIGAWLRRIGREGGKARARRHSREELAKWGSVRHQKAASDHSPRNS